MEWPQDHHLASMLDEVAAGVALPKLGLVRQRVEPARLDDPAATARAEVRRVVAAGGSRRGPVAVGVGSRGIAHIGDIVAAVVDELRRAGFEPFVVPAMGSHGGGTPEGQTEVLAGYGISSERLGVPVRATMETAPVGEVGGFPVRVDRSVVEAGRAFLVARVKPHTDFSGTIESGAAKMAAIGLGKRHGAQAIHALGIEGLRHVMPAVGRFVAERLLLGALAIVENELDETVSITGLEPGEIGTAREAALLEQARAALPRIPFGRLDVLVVDRIGKDISGTGMDPNVIGRWMVAGLDEPTPGAVRCVVALDLTDASHGNALGVGLADFAPRRLIAKIDPVTTYVNTLTSGWAGLQRGRLPMVFDRDVDAIRAAVAACGRAAGEPLRLAWITDTLHPQVLAVTDPLLDEARGRPDLTVTGEPFELPFDAAGTLAPLTTIAGA